MNIIIAGGGIGGLCAALCLAKAGHHITVLERAPSIREIGAGLQISPNAMRVLRYLDLVETLAPIAFAPEALEMRMGQTGRAVFCVPLGPKAKARWGETYLHVHRADLIDVLYRAAQGHASITIKLGQAVTGYTQTETRVTETSVTETSVTAHLAGGTDLKGELLVGADGIHSAIRTQMLGADRPRFTGNVAWRAVVPTAALGQHAPPPTACVWVGPGRHAVTYRLRGGDLTNFVGVVERDDWTTESWTEHGTKEEALKDFTGWDPLVTELIKNADSHYRWALFDRAPLSNWHEGRVVLLGDAGHPTLPFMAQGAAMAIEDGAILAKVLSQVNDGNLEAHLQAYFDARIGRTTSIQQRSRSNMRTFHKVNPLSQLATYGPMWLAGRIVPHFIRAQFDPIYRYDPMDVT